MGLLVFDRLFLLLVGPAIMLAFYAQLRVQSAFARYSRIGTTRSFTGADAARSILRSAGIQDVDIEMTRGRLSDHYDPRSKTLRLSQQVHDGRSIASVGIAAHEAGHAIQHAHNYAPLKFRSAVVPVAGIGSWLAWPMIIGGLFLRSFGLVQLGIVLFAALVVFQIASLPVEFNASRRAKAALGDSGIVVTDEEARGVSQVLSAAALTYVAATVVAIAQLLFFLLRFGTGSRD